MEGDEGCLGVVRGTMGLVMEVGEEFEKKGFKWVVAVVGTSLILTLQESSQL